MDNSNDYEELADCFIDVLSFTKKDWDQIEAIACELKVQKLFNADDFKCIVAAVAVWTDSGNGLREADH